MRLSEVRLSKGRMSKGRLSEVRLSKVRLSKGRLSKGRLSEVRMSEVRLSKGRLSGGSISTGIVPSVGAGWCLPADIVSHLTHPPPSPPLLPPPPPMYFMSFNPCMKGDRRPYGAEPQLAEGRLRRQRDGTGRARGPGDLLRRRVWLADDRGGLRGVHRDAREDVGGGRVEAPPRGTVQRAVSGPYTVLLRVVAVPGGSRGLSSLEEGSLSRV